MPKLPRISGKEVAGILEVNGFIKVRQRGSHMVLQKRLETTTVTVPLPDHKELKTGTLRSIIRQSGLSRSLFEK